MKRKRRLYQFWLHWHNIHHVGAQSLRPRLSMFLNQKARFLIIPVQTKLILLKNIKSGLFGKNADIFFSLSRKTPLLKYLFLACFIAIFCIFSQPVFAHLSKEITVDLNPNQLITNNQQPTTNNQQLITNNQNLWEQGRAYYEAGQFAAAARVWQQAALAYQSEGHRINQAMVLSNLALANQQLGKIAEAKDAIATSLALLEAEPDNRERQTILAQALNTQGSLQMSWGQAEAALNTLQQAEAAYRQAGDEAGIIRSLLNQAQTLRVMGLYRRSLDILNQVNQTLEAQPDSPLKAAGMRHLGNALRLVGDLPKSQEILQQSLKIAETLPSPPDISAALLSLGNTARLLQETDTALQYYQQAAAIPNSPTTRIQAQLNQLSLMLEKGIEENTQPLVQQIQAQLADLPPSRVTIYAQINFAQNLLKLQKKNNQAPTTIAQILATAIQQSQTLADEKAQAYALGSLGGLYEQTKQWTNAQKLTEEALVIAQSINASDIAYRWQWQLGRLLKAQGNGEGAIAAYEQAVKTLDSLRSDLVSINSEVQFSFREGVEPVYRELVGLLLEAGSTKTNPNNLEKARKVIESLQVAELDNFFRAACLETKPVQIDAIDREAAVIYPIILPDRLEVVLSLPDQSLRHYPTTISQKEIEDTVRELRRQITKRYGRRFLPPSQQVYDWLIRPAEADLQKNEVKTLVFVLDGVLRNIPMAALYDGEQYLVEKYGVALTPGLELLESQPLERGQLRVLTAGLSQARQNFSELPNVESELNQIQSQLPNSTPVLLNQEFTETAIKNSIATSAFPVIHLATHGQFSSQAENTFILTWDDNININELTNLLQTTDQQRSNPIELLVLSACETARGDNRAALGIAGVAVRAGARSTLATLWQVNDKATSTLMMKFYQELSNTTLTKAEALRRAQLSILEDPNYNGQPYYWAPFVLVGNWL